MCTLSRPETLSDRGPCQDPSSEGSLISTSGKKQRPGQKPGAPPSPDTARRLDGEDRARLEEDAELDQQRASSLQSGVGNQGLLAMMNKSPGESAVGTQIEVELDEEGAALEADQEIEHEVEGHETSILDTTGPPEVPDDDPLLWGRPELGGEDDPPKPPKPRKRPRRRRRPDVPPPNEPANALATEEEEDELSEDLQTVQQAAPLTPPDSLKGDEVHDALWGWLQVPNRSAQVPLEPEDLVGLDNTHPLSRCASAGSLLAKSSPSIAGRALGALARPLPGAPSLSSTVARAAAMATLGQALTAQETGTQAVNRAVSLALEDDTLPRAQRVAWELSREGRMWGPAIFEGCIRPARADPLDPGGPGAEPVGAALLAAALSQVAGPWGIQEIPPCPRPQPERDGDDLAWLDAAMAMQGPNPSQVTLDFPEVAPVILGVQKAVRSAARLQIELAAAATAAWRVAGDPVRRQLRAVLRALWRELGILARRAISTTKTLEQQIGRPHTELGPLFDQVDADLGDLVERLANLREDGLGALAAVLAAGTRPIEPGERP